MCIDRRDDVLLFVGFDKQKIAHFGCKEFIVTYLAMVVVARVGPHSAIAHRAHRTTNNLRLDTLDTSDIAKRDYDGLNSTTNGERIAVNHQRLR